MRVHHRCHGATVCNEQTLRRLELPVTRAGLPALRAPREAGHQRASVAYRSFRAGTGRTASRL